MTDQGILRTEVVLYYHKFSQLIGFPAEEMIHLEGDYSCDGRPLPPFDQSLRRRLVLHE